MAWLGKGFIGKLWRSVMCSQGVWMCMGRWVIPCHPSRSPYHHLHFILLAGVAPGADPEAPCLPMKSFPIPI